MNLIDAELDNRTPGIVRGWIRFHRRGKQPLRVVLELMGDFHQDIQGKIIRLRNPHPSDRNERLEREGTYMDGFYPIQHGEVGDITAGLPQGRDKKGKTVFCYTPYPYVEWYGPNGRIVLELDAPMVEVVDDTKVLKVLRNECEYQTEADAIRQLGSLIEGAMHVSVDKPESS